MLTTKAVFQRKENNLKPKDCVIEKVIRLDESEFGWFSKNLLTDCDFIADNRELMFQDDKGVHHCMLVVGDAHEDGILVQSEGFPYARYAAFMPNVQSFLTAQTQSPTLNRLNERLTNLVDWVVAEAQKGSGEDSQFHIDVRDMETQSGFELEHNLIVLDTILDMLGERSEIGDINIHKNDVIITVASQDLNTAMPEEKAQQIADFIVKSGTDNTMSGNWIMDFDEIGIAKADEVTANADAIIDALLQCEEVADVCINGNAFDVCYYLDFCPNAEDDGEDIGEQQAPKINM